MNLKKLEFFPACLIEVADNGFILTIQRKSQNIMQPMIGAISEMKDQMTMGMVLPEDDEDNIPDTQKLIFSSYKELEAFLRLELKELLHK